MKLFLTTCLLLNLNFATAGDYSPTELIVKLKPGATIPKLNSAKSIQNLFETTYVIRTNNLEKLEKELQNNPAIIYSERNKRAVKSTLPTPFATTNELVARGPKVTEFNDPGVNYIWSFLSAEKNGVSVDNAYKEYGTTNTTPVIVAVVDTGVDVNHEDLKKNIWVNQNEIPNNGVDDDNNGYIDDINGINTLVRDADGKATVNIKDTHSHGTHVSGTIAAAQNNGVGIAGIASNVKIMGIRTVPNSSDETDVDVAEAFIYAARNGAKIINCSFGKNNNEGRQLIPDTLKYIGEKFGVLVIVAAGNDSRDIDKKLTYPASLNSDNLLVIASTTSDGGLSGFSNFGKINVDVAAPGSSIYSTVPGNKYEYMSGTSMATPTTVGVAAEILSHNPNLTVAQLKDVLINSVTKVKRFQEKMVSGGRIDLLKGLELARTIK